MYWRRRRTKSGIMNILVLQLRIIMIIATMLQDKMILMDKFVE